MTVPGTMTSVEAPAGAPEWGEKTGGFDGATPADLAEPRLAENALTVLQIRYLKKNEEGEPIEAPRDLFWRVASVIAAEDRCYGATDDQVMERAYRFYQLMADGIFEPNSPTLMNAGRPLGQLAACFVLPVEDSLEEIYLTLRDMALIHQSGGGTGFGFSRLRPSGDVVRSTMGVASGPVSFMEVYDASTEAVKQGGTRRGANMGILRVDHPDILKFIGCKADKSRITNFNISVGVTDAFMEAVARGEDYDLRHPATGEVTARLSAEEVFSAIVAGAWRNGEPGVFFIDEANRYNPVPQRGTYEATNPCGEQPLLPYDVCNLGSVNVGHFASETDGVDWDGLGKAVRDSTRFLDNVVDANRYPLPKIEALAHDIRRIGLGVMGWADLLITVGEPYGSPRSFELAGEMMQFIDEESKSESERLAEERGAFPEWEQSIWGPDETCGRDADGERIRPERRLRNCNVTTVAPTGTISMIAGCSGGIEPLFAVAFLRNQAGVLMADANPDFVRRAKEGGWHSEDLMHRIAKEGHIHLDEVPEEVRRIFVTAHDVTPEQHIHMQAAFQAHCDSAISKTCNFPTEATEEDVRQIYELAHRLRCKGVTVYRDGSRDEQVLSTGKTALDVQRQTSESGSAAPAGSVEPAPVTLEVVDLDPEAAADVAAAFERLAVAEARNRELEEQTRTFETDIEEKQRRIVELEGSRMRRVEKRQRPKVLRGHTRQIECPLGTMYVTINEDDEGRPFEIFVALGKTGGAAMADAEAIGRLCSLALRSGLSLRDVHKQLRGISSDRAIGLGPQKVLSGPDAVAHVIEKHLEEKEGVQQDLAIEEAETAREKNANGGARTAQRPVIEVYEEAESRRFLGACPACGSSLAYEEGCMKCHACGWSRC